jgi:hypothetical protein
LLPIKKTTKKIIRRGGFNRHAGGAFAEAKLCLFGILVEHEDFAIFFHSNEPVVASTEI